MIGRVFGSYRVVDKIGEGGMGAVYLAEHQRIARRAAIKVLRPELANSQRLIERFFTEARATSLIRHPGIVEVLDCAVEHGCAYIVMEFLEGESLAAHLVRSGPLRNDGYTSVLLLGESIASAVGAAHAQQIIHRDLKPDNVFLARQPNDTVVVKILDFGIAKLASNEHVHRTSTGALLGTPVYMSPEQCRGAGRVSTHADIYSLGCILYEMVTGRPPFVKEGSGELIAAHLSEPPEPLGHVAPDVPAGLAALVAAMLAKAPDDRPATMADVAAGLRGIRDPALAGAPLPVIVGAGAEATRPSGSSGPLQTAVLTRTSPLPPTLLPRMRDSRTTFSASAFDDAGRPRPAARGRGLRWVLAGAVVAGIVAVAAVKMGGRPELATSSPTATKAPPTAPVHARNSPPPPAPPAAEAWVTVDLDSAPPHTTAVVDDERRPVPLRLPKGSAARQIRFEAPGYEPHAVAVDGARDRLLVFEWKPAAAPAETKTPSAHRPSRHTAVEAARTSGPAEIRHPEPALPAKPQRKPEAFEDL